MLESLDDVAGTAARITAMLDRWEAEDLSDESEWDIAEIEPISLHALPRTGQGTDPSP